MKLRAYWILACMLFATVLQAAQKDIAPLLEQLQLPMADSLKHQVSEQIEQKLVTYFSTKDGLKARIDSLSYIGGVADADSTLRIVTWNYGLSDGTYGFHAIFIKKNGKQAPLVHAFSTTQSTLPEINKKYTAKNWYGALYYRIVYHKKQYYLLGYNVYQPSTRVKLIDVLTYTNNRPVLGSKNFQVKKYIYKTKMLLSIIIIIIILFIISEFVFLNECCPLKVVIFKSYALILPFKVIFKVIF